MNPTRSSLILAMLGHCCMSLAQAQITLPYDAPQVVADERQQIVATLDLDGDGWQDAMGWWLDGPGAQNPDNGNLHGWINDGTGKLVLAWDVPYVGSSDSTIPRETIAVHGFDSDVGDDWALVAGDRIRIFLSNGGLPPTLAIDFDAGSPMRAIAVANFDAGDISRELAVVHVDGTLAVYEVLLGAGTLQLVSTRAAGIPIVGPLVAAEFTGDSAADLIVSGARLFPSIGGVLQPFSADFGLASDPQTYMFAHDVGDLDGDGDVDVVTFSMNAAGDSRTRVLRRTGPAALAAEPVHAGGPARKLADVDGDGDLDGVCCGGGGGPTGFYNDDASTFRVAKNDGTGQFAPAIEWPGLGSKAIAGVVDLDHDGDLDLVAGRNVHYAQGPVSAQPLPDPGAIHFLSDPWVGDVDGDGDPDMGLTLTGYSANLGDGSLVSRALSLPPPPAGATRIGDGYPGDWDGDGDIDLIAGLSWGLGYAGMELLLNVAPGSFESAGVVDSTVLHGVYGYARYTLDGDMDSDGDLDLAVQAGSDPNAHLFQNDGQAGFQYLGNVPGAFLLAMADLDGDGRLDLVGKKETGPTLQWARNSGAGTIDPWISIPGTQLTSGDEFEEMDQIVAADLDGDGDVDLATYFDANPPYGPDRARVLWNQGNALFSPQDLLQFSAKFSFAKRGPLAIDIHSDGRLDLLYGPLDKTANAVAVLLRNAENTDYLPARVQVLLQPFASLPSYRMDFAQGDLDGDGDPELVGRRGIFDMRFDGPKAGSRIQVGDGSDGQGGIAPLLGATGPFRVGHTAQVRLRGLRPGAVGVLSMVGTTSPMSAPFSGPMGRLAQAAFTQRIQFVASGAIGDAPGSGNWTHSFVVTPDLAGTTWHYEAVVVDPDALGGMAQSNLLVLTYGV